MRASFLFLGVALVAGCFSPGAVQTTSETVPLGDAQRVDVRVEQGAGTLTLAAGDGPLLNATARANSDILRPAVNYTVASGVGALDVRQRAEPVLLGTAAIVNEWTLRLASGVPLTIDVEHGAGATSVTLARLEATDVTIRGGAGTTLLDARDAPRLESFGVFTGAGSATIDARGAWDHNVTGSITSGAGSLTVRVPHDMPVRIVAHTGVGGVRATGLAQEGSVFTNALFGAGAPALRLDVSAGAGSLVLDAS